EMVHEYFPEITNVEFTVKMEEELDDVEVGKMQWITLIDDFYQDFRLRLDKAEKEMESIGIKDEPAGIDCEKCGHPMVYKMNRNAKYRASYKYPECRNTKAILKNNGVTSPTCKKGEVVDRKSKKNRTFNGRARYPNCKFVPCDKPIARSSPKR